MKPFESRNAYPQPPGKNARCVAAWASKGELARAAKRAPNARGELDLLHPQLWALWRSASPEAFDAIAGLADQREVARLSTCVDANGQGVVDYFASQPRKLATLGRVGVDLDRPDSTEISGWTMAPAVSQVVRCNLTGLLGLIQAGLAAPGPFPAEMGDALVVFDEPRRGARTALQLMAVSRRWDMVAEQRFEDVSRALAWLATGADPAMRNGQGQDALAMAIDAANPLLARALLSMGLNPTRKDAKGRDCMEILARRAKALRVEGSPARASELEDLLPQLLGVVERRELDLSSPWAPAPAPRRRQSL